jgi:hypothetical protein
MLIQEKYIQVMREDAFAYCVGEQRKCGSLGLKSVNETDVLLSGTKFNFRTWEYFI